MLALLLVVVFFVHILWISLGVFIAVTFPPPACFGLGFFIVVISILAIVDMIYVFLKE